MDTIHFSIARNSRSSFWSRRHVVLVRPRCPGGRSSFYFGLVGCGIWGFVRFCRVFFTHTLLLSFFSIRSGFVALFWEPVWTIYILYHYDFQQPIGDDDDMSSSSTALGFSCSGSSDVCWCQYRPGDSIASDYSKRGRRMPV